MAFVGLLTGLLAVVIVAALGGVSTHQYYGLANKIAKRKLPRDHALDPVADTAPFPIDLVVTWVNGNDPKWRAKRDAAWIHVAAPAVADNAADRYSCGDMCAPDAELLLCLRSAATFAPWLRVIWLVVDDGQVNLPRSAAEYWCDGSRGPVLRVVPHSVMFRAAGVPAYALPTFNSHAIEACVWAIPGLAPHFLYANDDVYFGNDVVPADFFSAAGDPVNGFDVDLRLPKSAHSAAWFTLAGAARGEVQFAHTELLPCFISPHHTVVALTVQQGVAAANGLPWLTTHWRNTTTSKFRHARDIPPIAATAVLGLLQVLPQAGWSRPAWTGVRVRKICTAADAAVGAHLTWSADAGESLKAVLRAVDAYISSVNGTWPAVSTRPGAVVIVAKQPQDVALWAYVSLLTAPVVHVVVAGGPRMHWEVARVAVAARRLRARAWGAPAATLTFALVPPQALEHHLASLTVPIAAVVTRDPDTPALAAARLRIVRGAHWRRVGRHF